MYVVDDACARQDQDGSQHDEGQEIPSKCCDLRARRRQQSACTVLVTPMMTEEMPTARAPAISALQSDRAEEGQIVL